VEWLRASRRDDALDPSALRAWNEADPDDFARAFASFAPDTETATRQERIAVLFAEWDAIRPRSSGPGTP
jgi:hypothetical protein